MPALQRAVLSSVTLRATTQRLPDAGSKQSSINPTPYRVDAFSLSLTRSLCAAAPDPSKLCLGAMSRLHTEEEALISCLY